MSTVDCSRYQGVLSVVTLQAWAAAGVTRVILKAGGGDSGRYQDSQWVTNSGNVRTAGLILEAYWFNGTTDPAGDAAFVVSFVPAGVRIWADVESEGSMAHWSDDQADTFESAVVAAGHPSGSYMSSSVTFGSWPKCSRRPLWVASYGGSSVPHVGNWAAPVLWQYTSSGHLPGYGGNLDLDEDLAGLSALASTPITQSFEEDDMKVWKLGNSYIIVDHVNMQYRVVDNPVATEWNGFKNSEDKGAYFVPIDQNGWADLSKGFVRVWTPTVEHLDVNALALAVAAAVGKPAGVDEAAIQDAATSALKAFFGAASK
jgi:GH25 family lysozyme M1 (1,4-beta-N-acetylmuramidase)